jgi:pimeloyl-ACP methyl ester carboxylesterase
MNRRSRRRLLLVIVIIPVGLMGWGVVRDATNPRGALVRRTQPVVHVLREPLPGLGLGVERWRIVLANGDTVRALWRRSTGSAETPWTVVLMGGLHTGDRAALILPEGTTAHVLAVDWPWTGPRRMSVVRFVVSLPAIREALLRTPGTLAAGLAAVRASGEVDRERVASLGASLGAPIAVAALSVGDRPAALVLIDAGGDLCTMLRAEADRYAPGWIAAIAGPIAAWLVRPLEPEVHASAAAGLPTLLLGAQNDERLPAGVRERMHALVPHAEARWREGPHIRPHQEATIEALTAEIAEWLERCQPSE